MEDFTSTDGTETSGTSTFGISCFFISTFPSTLGMTGVLTSITGISAVGIGTDVCLVIETSISSDTLGFFPFFILRPGICTSGKLNSTFEDFTSTDGTETSGTSTFGISCFFISNLPSTLGVAGVLMPKPGTPTFGISTDTTSLISISSSPLGFFSFLIFRPGICTSGKLNSTIGAFPSNFSMLLESSGI